MGLFVALIIIVLLLAVWGHGPRKTTAQTIILGEDAKDQVIRAAKATPAKAREAKKKAEQVTAKAVVTGTAVAKVGAERTGKIAAVVATKSGEVYDESKHYVKGFTSDVARMRQQIKADRKRDARAKKAMEQSGLKQVV